MNNSIAGIIFQDGLFLVGRRVEGGQMGGKWEFPGGKVDPGETHEQTIIREFHEELGLDAKPGEHITSVTFENNSGTVELHAYRVFLSLEENVTLSEHSELSWATMAEIESLDMVDSDKLLVPFLKEWSLNDQVR